MIHLYQICSPVRATAIFTATLLFLVCTSLSAMPESEGEVDSSNTPNSEVSIAQTVGVPLASLKPQPVSRTVSESFDLEDYQTFTLDTAGYVNIWVTSRTGARISIADRRRGTFASSGIVGERNGRMDLLLDAGEYRLAVLPADGEQAQVHVRRLDEIETSPTRLMENRPGTLQELSLADGQQRTMWIEISEDQPFLDIEAVGRALSSVSIWKDGFLIDESLSNPRNAPVDSDRPLNYFEGTLRLDAGVYRLVFAGGSPLVWTDNSTAMPFFVRFGVDELGEWVDEDITISAMGSNSYLVDGQVSFFQIEDADYSETRLSASSRSSGGSRYTSSRSASISPDSESIRQSFTLSGNPGMGKWLVVTGEPGQVVHVRAFSQRSRYTLDDLDGAPRFFLSTLSDLDSDGSIDATPLLIRNETRTQRAQVISSESIEVSRSEPLTRLLNTSGEYAFLVNFADAGRWGIMTDSPEGEEPDVSIIPVSELLQNRADDLPRANPASFEVDEGMYYVQLNVRRPGITRFHLYFRGLIAVINDNRAKNALEEPGIARRDVSWFSNESGPSLNSSLTFTMNPRAGVSSSLFAAGIPLSFGDEQLQSFPVTLDAGENMSVRISLEEAGLLVSSNSAITLSTGNASRAELEVAAGSRTLTMANTSGEIVTGVIRFIPNYTGNFQVPEVQALSDIYPTVEPNQPRYDDYDYDNQRVRRFLLEVREPGFYNLQTTGRLATTINVRTPAFPRGISAEANGPGRNALLQSYFRRGEYLVEVGVQRSSSGRAGLELQALPTDDLGRMSEGEIIRTVVPANSGTLSQAVIRETGRYNFQTIVLQSNPETRLEDMDGWLVESSTMPAGLYRYYSWPQTVENRRLLQYTRTLPRVEYDEDAIWPLEINSSRQRIWMESESRAPHQYSLDIPADISMRISVHSAMEWWISDTNGEKLLEGQGSANIIMPAAAAILSTRPKEENNEFSYSLQLSTSVLVEGTSQSMSSSGSSLEISIGEAGLYDIWSLGTWDIRGVLRGDDGEIVQADDRPGDWNFSMLQYLEPGTYQLYIYSVFGSRGGNTRIYLDLKPEILTEAVRLPVNSEIGLSNEFLAIPFTSPLSGLVRLALDTDSVPIALYDANQLIGRGNGEIVASVEAGHEYLFRIQGTSREQIALNLSMENPQARILNWDGNEGITVEPGATLIRNPSGMSLSPNVPTNNLLVSDVLPAVLKEAAIFPGEGRELWVWNGSDTGVNLSPLRIIDNRRVTLDMDERDIAAAFTPDSNHVYIVSAESVSGRIGINGAGFPFAPDAHDWSRADMEQGETILGMAGDDFSQVWFWDGQPREGLRRVQAGYRSFTPGQEVDFDGSVVVNLAPGEARYISVDGAVRLLMTPGTVAFSAGDAGRTVAARTRNRQAELNIDGRLYLINRGAEDALIRVDRISSVERTLLTGDREASTMLSAQSDFTIHVAVDGDSPVIGLWANNPTGLELLAEDGAVYNASPPDENRPFWVFPAVSGIIRGSADPGPVSVWTGSEDNPVPWILRSAADKGMLEAGTIGLSNRNEKRSFTLEDEAFVILSTNSRGMTLLRPVDGEGSTLLAAGSGDERQVIGILQAGDYEVITAAFAGEPQAAPLDFRVLEIQTAGEANPLGEQFLGSSQALVFAVDVMADSPVGIGVQTEQDDFTISLIDESLQVISTGRLFYRSLDPGRYYVLIENGAEPMKITPVVYADGGSRTGVPEDVSDSYRGDAE